MAQVLQIYENSFGGEIMGQNLLFFENFLGEESFWGLALRFVGPSFGGESIMHQIFTFGNLIEQENNHGMDTDVLKKTPY